MPSGEVANVNFIVFGLTKQRIEPMTSTLTILHHQCCGKLKMILTTHVSNQS